MLPGLLLSIFFWAIHQFINADVKDLCENIQLNVFDHPLAAFNALYGVFINVKPFQLHFGGQLFLWGWTREQISDSFLPSSTSEETPKKSAKAASSISVTKRSPCSIRWIAFLSMSIPFSCIRSARILCEVLSGNCFRSFAICSPQRLHFPSICLFLNMTYSLHSFSFDIYNLPMEQVYGIIQLNLTCWACQ